MSSNVLLAPNLIKTNQILDKEALEAVWVYAEDAPVRGGYGGELDGVVGGNE